MIIKADGEVIGCNKDSHIAMKDARDWLDFKIKSYELTSQENKEIR